MINFALILMTNTAFLAALVLTGLLRRYAIRANLMDVAGERSSHDAPTPRGGGASIVLVTLAGLLVAPVLLGTPWSMAIGLSGGGAAVALIGWFDDHGHVSPLIRLAAHFFAAIWLISWLGPFPLDRFWAIDGIHAAVSMILTVLYVVWMINLYNFMDGIDGLAAGEAIVVVLAGVLIMLGGKVGSPAILGPPLLVAASALGFLPWNWPPARIFMGDASSGFLGFILAALAVGMGQVLPQYGFAWAVLPGVFIADATVTLLRRLWRREKVYQAHRTHMYQRWSRRIKGHLPITVAMLTVTWLWLFPLAYLIANGAINHLMGAGVAMLPLFAAAALLGAGRGSE